MSPKAGHKERRYEMLRKSDFSSPFPFNEWQLDNKHMLMREKLRERKYTVKDTDIPYRVINHWEVKKLIPEGVNAKGGREEDGWRMFSLTEMVWLKIISRLRNFDFSLKKILNVKKAIVHWNSKYEYYPSLEYNIAVALFSERDTYLRISSVGDADLISTERIEMEKILGYNKDVILISLKSILREIGLEFKEIKGRLDLSDEEFEMIEQIRDENISEVKAGLKKGKITELEASRMFVDPVEGLSEVKKMEENGEYGRVEEQIEKGNKRSVRVVRRKRFDK